MERHYCILIVALAVLVAVSGSLITVSQRSGAKYGVPAASQVCTTSRYRALLSPSAAALRTARWWRLRAQEQAARQREAVESWDPEVGERTGFREWSDWRAQMAQDRGGNLRHAETAAEQAVALARSSGKIYQATETLALIECNRGHHEAELRAARRLMALDPENELSLFWLRHAARCNHLRAVE